MSLHLTLCLILTLTFAILANQICSLETEESQKSLTLRIAHPRLQATNRGRMLHSAPVLSITRLVSTPLGPMRLTLSFRVVTTHLLAISLLKDTKTWLPLRTIPQAQAGLINSSYMDLILFIITTSSPRAFLPQIILLKIIAAILQSSKQWWLLYIYYNLIIVVRSSVFR